MLSLTKLFHLILVCGMIPLTVWSGVPRTGCQCLVAVEGCPRCGGASEDSQKDDRPDCCKSSCCSRAVEASSADGESNEHRLIAHGDPVPPLLALPPSSCEVCRCPARPVNVPSETTDARGEFQAAFGAIWPDSIIDPAAFACAPQLPSSTERPPLDRLSLFCVLLV